jgi:nucleotide-binding universal stress UspA family protein
VEDVPAYSHSNRWVRVGGACSDAWIVVIAEEQVVSWSGAAEAFLRYTEHIQKHATSVLDRVANAAKQAGVPCDTIQVQDVQPYEGIIATVTDRGCDLIVMASHGCGGLSAIVLSVTNKVLTYTKVPVLVIQ